MLFLAVIFVLYWNPEHCYSAMSSPSLFTIFKTIFHLYKWSVCYNNWPYIDVIFCTLLFYDLCLWYERVAVWRTHCILTGGCHCMPLLCPAFVLSRLSCCINWFNQHPSCCSLPNTFKPFVKITFWREKTFVNWERKLMWCKPNLFFIIFLCTLLMFVNTASNIVSLKAWFKVLWESE